MIDLRDTKLTQVNSETRTVFMATTPRDLIEWVHRWRGTFSRLPGGQEFKTLFVPFRIVGDSLSDVEEQLTITGSIPLSGEDLIDYYRSIGLGDHILGHVTTEHSSSVEFDVLRIEAYRISPSPSRSEVRLTWRKHKDIEPLVEELFAEISLRWPEPSGDTLGQPDTPSDDGRAATNSALSLNQQAKLRGLWLNNSLTFDDIAEQLGPGYSGEYIRKLGYSLAFPKRKPGRKSGR